MIPTNICNAGMFAYIHVRTRRNPPLMVMHADKLCPCVPPLRTHAVIFDAMEDSKKWQVKEGALKLLAALARTAPAQVSVCLPAIVPLISERMVDAREQVRGGGGWGVGYAGVVFGWGGGVRQCRRQWQGQRGGGPSSREAGIVGANTSDLVDVVLRTRQRAGAGACTQLPGSLVSGG